MKDVDVVIHAAAALPLWPKKEIWDINVNGTKTILDVALEENVGRVIFISSTSVYGVPREGKPMKESDKTSPLGEYARSKLVTEELCRSYRDKGLTVPILRPTTFTGPGRLGIFSLLFDWIKEGLRVPIIGDGKKQVPTP